MYEQIRWLHIGCVTLSGAMFAARGLAVSFSARWPMTSVLRHSSYTIDTGLLGAGVYLAVVSHQYPFVAPWLTMKVLLLAVYVVLGSYALKRGRTPRARLLCYLAAIAVYLLIVSVAMSHSPLGLLALVVS